MEDAVHISAEISPEQKHTGHLDTAARTAGARADEHQADQNRLREIRPLIEIHGRVSGRRDNRCDLERGMADCRLKARRISRLPEDIDGDQHDAGEHDSQIQSQLLIMECLRDMLQDNQVIQAEIDTEQQHEDGRHILRKRRVCRTA